MEVSAVQIDQLLREDGEHWRSQLAPPREFNVDAFSSRERSRPYLRVLSAIATLGVLVAGLWVGMRAIPLLDPSERPGTSSSPAAPTDPPASVATAPPSGTPPPADPYVDDGDAVSATGHVVEWFGGQAVLCAMLLDMGGVACDEQRVPIEGLNPRDLPGDEIDGIWASNRVTVLGTWAEGKILADRWDPAAASESPLLPNACEAPAGGWRDNENTDASDDFELAVNTLAATVAADPDRYVGSWFAVAAEPEGARVMVVGTVTDLAEAEAELVRIFPFNLCVVAMPFSARQLGDVEARLSNEDLPGDISVDVTVGRVAVRTLVFDRDIAIAIEPYRDRVTVRPLVNALP